MLIKEYAMSNFQIDYENDSNEEIMMKRFYLNNDRVSRQVIADEERERKDFDKNYDKIMKMDNLKNLKLQIMAIDELLN